MRFVEESEGAFSAAQLAAAERELEEQKKEWELGRLRALREEEEQRMRLADDDEKPLTFGREDAQNQVNSTAAKGGSKRLVSKRLAVPSRRSLRRRGGNRVGRARIESSSESENETTSTESDSQEEDIVEDSLDEESSHTESQSQGDEEEEGEGGGGGEKEEEDDEEEEAGEESEDGRANDRDYSERGGGFSRRKGRLAGSGSCSRNHFDLNSPRTRSRGNVQINLWTLDVSPILPGVKPNCRRQRKKFHRAKSEETLFSSDTCSKKNVRINMSAKVQSTNSHQNTKTSEIAEIKQDSTRNDMDSINLNSVEQRVASPNVERPTDDQADPLTSVVKTQSEQTKTSESNLDNAEGSVKEKNDEKIVNGTNLITVCSVHVTRCSQKMLSATYRKFESEVNRNEDAENLDVNVSARNSRSSPSAILPDASLKRSKESTGKSKSEFGLSANSLCNNARGKLSAATSRESGSVESSSSRSVPLLRSKTLRNASPDAVDKISKPLAISRVSIAQRNSKTNADDTRSNMVENENKDRVCDNDNDNAESISSTRKYTSQRYNSKSDTRENLNLNVASLQVSEKGTDDSVSNVSDSLIASSVKSESNSNESKYNIRRLEVALARSVTTRSSKIPSISNYSEESNCRLIDDKVESLPEAKSRSQAKMYQGTRRTDLTGSQNSVAEQSRTTRLIVPPLMSPPLTDEMTSSKLTPRRRPDTPLPRPVTRSAVIMNTSARVSPSRGEKYATRNSKQCQDNGLVNLMTPVSPVLFGRSKSIPDPKETSVMAAKRRPDTPRPNIPPSYNEQVSRVTRSGLTLNSSASSAKSASSSLLSPATSALKTSIKQPRISPTSSENETPTSLVSSYEKPQRTAKVVAILSLDTRNHNSNKTFSSIQPKSIANCETKGQDKELLPRLSPKDQEADREECDSPDIKSKKLRREMKRIKNAVSCSIEDERANSDDSSDREPMQKRSFRSHLSLSSSSSSTVVTTRSDKLRNATIS